MSIYRQRTVGISEQERHFKLFVIEMQSINPEYTKTPEKLEITLDFPTYRFTIRPDHRNRAVVSIKSRIEDNWKESLILKYSNQISNMRRYLNRQDKKTYARDINRLINKHINNRSDYIKSAETTYHQNLDKQLQYAELQAVVSLEGMEVQQMTGSNKESGMLVIMYETCNVSFFDNGKVGVKLVHFRQLAKDETPDPEKSIDRLVKMQADIKAVNDKGYTLDKFKNSVESPRYSWRENDKEATRLDFSFFGDSSDFPEIHDFIKTLNTGRLLVRQFMTNKMRKAKK